MDPLKELRIYSCEHEIHLVHWDKFDVLATHWRARAEAQQLIITEWKGFTDDPTPRGEMRTQRIEAPECTDCDPVQELWRQAGDRIQRHYRFKDGE